MKDYRRLAEILFPDVHLSLDAVEEMYPKRNLSSSSFVTRFAPSPTGFIHIGSIYTALISERFARQTGGIFILRIEDTDKKREITGGIREIVDSLKLFGIRVDEGVVDEDTEVGHYGPYQQSRRTDIYKQFAKLLVAKGQAYPCFCTAEELEELRTSQERMKVRPGYYGEWAVHRNMTMEDVEAELAKGKPFVIRLRSNGDHNHKFVFKDLVKGPLELSQNDQDAVLLKSDGLPTYHFAHVVDDHLMGTTHVIRGDEWLSSVPLHVELFDCFRWQKPHFAHISPILKEEGKSRRKLSKRKDPEAAVKYYHEQGFPNKSVIDYLLTLANSNFEEWRMSHRSADSSEFVLTFEHMSTSGSLFDMGKLIDISKNVIAQMSAIEVYDEALQWAQEFDPDLAALMHDASYCVSIFDIERAGEKPRKDIAKWSDVRYHIEYLFDELFHQQRAYDFPGQLDVEDVKEILRRYPDIYSTSDSKAEWFEKIRDLAESLNFARDVKTYKKNPDAFKGHVGDVSMVLRIALTGRMNTPDLYEIMMVLGKSRVMERIRLCLADLD